MKTETPVKTRVVEARKTAEKGVFAYTLPNEKQERKVQIGNATILKGIAHLNRKGIGIYLVRCMIFQDLMNCR